MGVDEPDEVVVDAAEEATVPGADKEEEGSLDGVDEQAGDQEGDEEEHVENGPLPPPG